MSALGGVMYREGKIRATNLTFIFWDLFYPLGYLLVFGVGMTAAMGFTAAAIGVDYNAFFLAGVLGMASFGIASNTAWSFFMDRDNGIFYEMLTYPMSRSQYLLGKVLFNLLHRGGAGGRDGRARADGAGRAVRWARCRCSSRPWSSARPAGSSSTPSSRSRIRRNDAFNTVTSIFYFVLPVRELDVLPDRAAAVAAAASSRWRTRSPGRSTCCATPRSASAIRGASRWKQRASLTSTLPVSANPAGALVGAEAAVAGGAVMSQTATGRP